MASNSDQCAVAEDGTLLDASRIAFYNDPDDDTPLPDSVSVTSSTTGNLHPFFRGGPAPSTFVSGTRRSGRVTRPSARITDPNNVEASTSRKRSATTTTLTEATDRSQRRAKLAMSVCGSEEDDRAMIDSVDDIYVEEETDVPSGATTDDDEGTEENFEEAYLVTKVMGDSDRRVCLPIAMVSLFKSLD